VSDKLPFTYTGADLYALCSDAMLKAITRQAEKVDEKVAAHNRSLRPGQPPITIAGFFDHFATEDDISVMVTEEDFYSAYGDLIPSVSAEELGHYDRVRRAFEGTGDSNSSSNGKSVPPKSAGHQQKQSLPMLPPSRPSSLAPSEKASSVKSTKLPVAPKGDRSTFYFSASTDANGDDEDEYVIRSDHLGANGRPNDIGLHRNGNGNGSIVHNSKGKGKSAFGSATDGDEDLYG
jgi:peroxin-6